MIDAKDFFKGFLNFKWFCCLSTAKIVELKWNQTSLCIR